MFWWIRQCKETDLRLFRVGREFSVSGRHHMLEEPWSVGRPDVQLWGLIEFVCEIRATRKKIGASIDGLRQLRTSTENILVGIFMVHAHARE